MARAFRTVVVLLAAAAAASCAIDFGSGPRLDPNATPDGDGGREASKSDSEAPTGTPDLSDPERWSFFDLASIRSAADAKAPGVGAAAFDGTYLYVFPAGGTQVHRLDTRAAFEDTKAWETAALLKPYHASGAVVCDTELFLTSSTDEPILHRSKSTAFGKGFDDVSPSAFQQGTDAGVVGFAGTECSNGAVYLAPSSGRTTLRTIAKVLPTQWTLNGPRGSFRGAVHLTPGKLLLVPGDERTGSLFTSVSDWQTGGFTLDAVKVAADYAFDGAIYDGHFTYLAPATGKRPARIDATAKDPVKEAWDLGPELGMGTAHGGVFDGRFVYFAPAKGTSFARFDTLASFGSPLSYGSFDITTLAKKPAALGALGGAAFDGKYVYFTPSGSSVIARFRTNATGGMPASFSGSFY